MRISNVRVLLLSTPIPPKRRWTSARVELSTAEGIRQRFAGGVGADDVRAPAAAAAARAAGQAVAAATWVRMHSVPLRMA